MQIDRGAEVIAVFLGLALLLGMSGASMAATHKAKLYNSRPHNSKPSHSKSLATQVAERRKPLPPLAPLLIAKTTLATFKTAPFPYRGLIPDTGKHFLDVTTGNRLGHGSRDGVHWEDEVYRDSRVLLYIPAGFDVRRPALMVVFFHGNGTLLMRDVVERQHVADQLAQSGSNAVLVAPQLALDAADSSAGRLWKRRGFNEFIAEAGARLTELYGDVRAKPALSQLPVVMVAYSGGYLPAAWSLARGGANNRLRGVVLLDAVYGHVDKFTDWILKARPPVFFFSAYSESTREGNQAVMQELNDERVVYRTTLPTTLARGGITILATDPTIKHEDFVSHAWVDNPLTWVLTRIPGYSQKPATLPRKNRAQSTTGKKRVPKL
ncbi:MAG: alpha/beta hydrolase [Gammaproteobacteria bacterium]|nr:alpha/beta hydrolase [Gammaproteobacteria bacterium]